MNDIWYFKQAKLIFALQIEDFEVMYDESSLINIKKILSEINELPDFLKREIVIDTLY
ncbi:MAG: hypothetical protein SPJ04_04565 [Bdellovibrionota bacterium]|nr:hypothetical protein [Pseudomonadota bacterium]MDY6090509.1 hypothetical protein [Bdellovibrionota bacterium]